MSAFRLRITHAQTGDEYVYGNAQLGAGEVSVTRSVRENVLRYEPLTLAVDSYDLLGAASKAAFPSGRHRAVLEESRDGEETWTVRMDGVVTRERVTPGQTYNIGEGQTKILTRTWGVTVTDRAIERVLDVLDTVALQDVAADVVDNSNPQTVQHFRLTGDPVTPEESVNAAMWPLRECVERAFALAGVTLTSALPEAFAWERVYDDLVEGEPVPRLARHVEGDLRRVVFGRPQLTNADPELYGDHPTMPNESALWLFDAWRQAQQLLVVARYEAYPSADVEVEVLDVQALADPQVALVRPEIELVVDDGYEVPTEAALDDGEPIADYAIVMAGGPDGSAVEDRESVDPFAAETQPQLQGTYAAGVTRLSGAAGAREVENGDVFQLPWRLAAHNDLAFVNRAADPSHPGYSETTWRGVPVFAVTDSYLGPSGGTPEQPGNADLVTLLVVERPTTGDPWRSVEKRNATRTAGGAVTGMEIWASEIYRRHDLAAGEVDVLEVGLPEADLDADAVEYFTEADGAEFDGLGYAVRSLTRELDERGLVLELVRPSGGWNVAPADGSTGSGSSSGGETGSQRLAPVVSVTRIGREEYNEGGIEEGDPYTDFYCDFLAAVPGESAPPLTIEVEFIPVPPPLLAFSVVSHGRYITRASAIDTQPGWGGPHPYEGQTFRARAVYPGGYTTAWAAVTANE